MPARPIATAAVLIAGALAAPAGAATVMPSITSIAAPGPTPASFPAAGLSAGDAMPKGDTVLRVQFPTAPTSGDRFTVSCPSGSQAAAWTDPLELESHAGAVDTFSALPVGDPTLLGYVLCVPSMKASLKLLPTSTRAPAPIFGPGYTLGAGKRPAKGYRIVRITVSGMSAKGWRYANPACPSLGASTVLVGSSQPVPPKSVSIVLNAGLWGIPNGPGDPTSATIYAVCHGVSQV